MLSDSYLAYTYLNMVDSKFQDVRSFLLDVAVDLMSERQMNARVTRAGDHQTFAGLAQRCCFTRVKEAKKKLPSAATSAKRRRVTAPAPASAGTGIF